MIPWLRVSDKWKEPADTWGKANGMWHLLTEVPEPVVEPYNEALALVGLPEVDSLSVLLASSSMCTALAGNAEAYTIMKTNYSGEMVDAIDSAWSDGLNKLNFICRLKCYIFRNGAITGLAGVTSLLEDHKNDYAATKYSNYLRLSASGHRDDGSSNAGGSYLFKSLSPKVSMSGWSKLGAYAYGNDTSRCFVGLASHDGGSKSYVSSIYDVAYKGLGSTGEYTIGLSGYQGSYYVKFGSFSKDDEQITNAVNMYHIWLE